MEKPCSEPDCNKPAVCKGWCNRHYYTLRTTPPCAVPGCEKPIEGKGYCAGHAKRLKRHGSPTAGGPLRGEVSAWIESHLSHAGEACLIWPFAKSTTGYGVATFEGRYCSAHRVVCIKAHGPPPSPAHDAAHSCGNGHKGCVHPEHLRWATKSENTYDAIRHGTHPAGKTRGETHGTTKLKDDQVRQIRALKASGESYGNIAERFPVSASAVRNIVKGITWGHLV